MVLSSLFSEVKSHKPRFSSVCPFNSRVLFPNTGTDGEGIFFVILLPRIQPYTKMGTWFAAT